MKNILMVLILMVGVQAQVQAEQVCEVKVCNKLKRFSLNPWSHVKDSLGKVCFDAVLPKSEAYKGNTLDSTSKWYQGSSINPTKRSVTYVSKVYGCK